MINQLFGVATGLGMSVINFDWTQIAYIGSPLMVPWWAQVHIFAGFVIFYWILCPILYYNNVRVHPFLLPNKLTPPPPAGLAYGSPPDRWIRALRSIRATV